MNSYYQVTYMDGIPVAYQNLGKPPKSKPNKLAQLIFSAETIERVEAMDDPFSVCSGKTTADALNKIAEAMQHPNREISLKLPSHKVGTQTRDFTNAVKEIIEKLEFQFFTFSSVRQTIKFDI